MMDEEASAERDERALWAVTFNRRGLTAATRPQFSFSMAAGFAELLFSDQSEFPGKPHIHRVRLPPIPSVYRGLRAEPPNAQT